MTKKATTPAVSDSQNNASEINAAIEAVNDKLTNTISRDGSTPNQMEADLDLNSNDVINVSTLSTATLNVAGVKLVSATAVPSWEGAWTTATSYVVDDIVSEAGSTYICLVAHTSTTFSTDLTNNYWELFAAKGSAGAGTGDMLAANNLSDVANVATARANLGLGTAATTASTAYATAAQGTKADNALPLASVLDEDDFATDSATLPPSQQSVGAYVGAYVASEIASIPSENMVKAWVNFNGTGTVAIRASYNVSSITDLGVGRYKVNFTNALADANYTTVSTALSSATTAPTCVEIDYRTGATYSTTSVTVAVSDTNAGSLVDSGRVSVVVVR